MSRRTIENLTTVFAILTLVLALIIGTAIVARAGEVEAEVISEAEQALFQSFDDVDGSDAFFAHTSNLLDIWNDTEAGSHCEQYVASLVTISYTASAFAFAVEDGDESIYAVATSVAVDGLQPLVRELDTLYTHCLNEEF